MPLHRRSLLGITAGASLAAALPARAGPPPTVSVRAPGRVDYGPALAAVAAYGQSELDGVGLPGMTLAFADADGFRAAMTLGYADVATATPVRADHLFQVGSISKSFAALALFALADQGKVDLDAPLARYVPDAPLPPEPITVAQVLSHSSGLPDDAPTFPEGADPRLWTGFAPGSRFSYSNTGYTLLGLAIARASGEPHPAAIRRLVIAPLGLQDVTTTLRDADHARYATGYAPFPDDTPDFPRVRMAPGPWTQDDFASGSIAAPPEAMAGYLRFLIGLGRGQGAPLLSEAAAKRFTTAVIDAPVFGPKARYANGLAIVPVEGRPCLHHTGGMLTFSSSLHVDAPAGVGAFASVNARWGDYRPRRTSAFAVSAMRAVREGRPIPAPPALPLPPPVTRPEQYAGRWLTADGSQLEIVALDRGPVLRAEGAEGRLQAAGKTLLVTDHPRYAARALEFEGMEGSAPRLWWGSALYGRDAAPPAPARVAEIAALAGLYVSHDPWSPTVEVVARGGRLFVGGGELKRHEDGAWRSDDPDEAIERFRFDQVINGRPQRLLFSGAPLQRLEAG